MHLIEALPPLEAFLWGALATAFLGLLFLLLCFLVICAWFRLTRLSLDIDQTIHFAP